MTNIYGNNMLLISSLFKGNDSFSMIPVTDDCPYVEVLFDPSNKLLVVISKLKKEVLHMVPRLDESGNPMKDKLQKFKEQRIQIETFNEVYIIKKEEIINFISNFAVNKDFDYLKFFINDTLDS